MKNQISISRTQGQLKEFISNFKLMNRNSIVDFDAKIKITTSKRQIEIASRVFVTFEGNHSGKLSLLTSEIDPNEFPTEFIVDYQDFEFIDEIYLKISGVHTRNPEIGVYMVKIFGAVPRE